MHEDSQEDEDEQEDAEEKQAKGLADLMGKGSLHRALSTKELQINCMIVFAWP